MWTGSIRQTKTEQRLWDAYVKARNEGDGPAAGQAIGKRDRLVCGRRRLYDPGWEAGKLPGFREAYSKARAGRGTNPYKMPVDLVVVTPDLYAVWAYRKYQNKGVFFGRGTPLNHPLKGADLATTDRAFWSPGCAFEYYTFNNLRDYVKWVKAGRSFDALRTRAVA